VPFLRGSGHIAQTEKHGQQQADVFLAPRRWDEYELPSALEAALISLICAGYNWLSLYDLADRLGIMPI
jgi:hypothetical protein